MKPTHVDLNFHHLRYFWAVARAGSIAQASRELRLSAPALSVQVQALEASLGHELFERRGRGLVLTRAGTVVLDYANTIFATGQELVGALGSGAAGGRRNVRVGAVSTLSRNFQLVLLAPLLRGGDTTLLLRSGALSDLMEELEQHRLDIVLTNVQPSRSSRFTWVSHALAEQRASLVGRARARPYAKSLRALCANETFVLPTVASGLRQAFDALVAREKARPNIIAEVDDMAMLRLLAREHDGLALVPPIVVKDELTNGRLVEVASLPSTKEVFFAITGERRGSNPVVDALLAQPVSVDEPESRASQHDGRGRTSGKKRARS
ncbi:MAG: LysR family transcriptional regulator [Polyangiaceae bacterium]